MLSLLDQTYYDILEVPASADAEGLRRAYLIARATFQPDSPATYSIFSDEDSSALLQRVEEAYAVLSDPERRVVYDRELTASAPQGLVDTRPAEPAQLADLDEREPAAIPRAEGTPGLAPPLRRPLVPPATVRVTDRRPRVIEEEPEEFAMLIERTAPRESVGPSSLADGLEPEDGIYDGAVLRRIRMSQGIELAEIAARSKVSMEHLQSIEEDRFDALPSAVYVRGFVREYARCLQLDPGSVGRSYYEMMSASRGRRS